MRAPRLVATRVDIPQHRRGLQLGTDDADQCGRRGLLDAKDSAGMAQIAQLNGNTEPVVIATVLADECAIRTRRRVAADQLALLGWEGEQLLPLRGVQQLAAWHDCPS